METLTESYINIKNLRKINVRSKPGVYNRRPVKLTLTPSTMDAMTQHVRFAKGGYGSPFIELSIRLLLAMIGNGEDMQSVCEDLKLVSNSPYLYNNARLYKSIMEKLEN